MYGTDCSRESTFFNLILSHLIQVSQNWKSFGNFQFHSCLTRDTISPCSSITRLINNLIYFLLSSPTHSKFHESRDITYLVHCIILRTWQIADSQRIVEWIARRWQSKDPHWCLSDIKDQRLHSPICQELSVFPNRLSRRVLETSNGHQKHNKQFQLCFTSDWEDLT